MRKETLQEAIDEIDPSYIEEYLQTQDQLAAAPRKGTPPWVRFLPIAAAMAGVLMILGMAILPALRREPDLPPVETRQDSENDETTTQNEQTAEEEKPSESAPSLSPPLQESPDGPVPSESVPSQPPPPQEAPEDPVPSLPDVPLLSPDALTSDKVTGEAYKETGDPTAGTVGSPAQITPPCFPVDTRALILTAKATEILPHTYESVAAYGTWLTTRYRMIKMTVLDPLDSGMSGEFLYAMPADDLVDVLRYDALLIAVKPTSNSLFRRLSTDELVTLPSVFTDVWDTPLYWHMIPFTDGVFDEALASRLPASLYNAIRDKLDPAAPRDDPYDRYLIVCRGSTYEEAIQTVMTLRAEFLAEVPDPDAYGIRLDTGFTSPEALEIMASILSAEEGIYNYTMYGGFFSARRYINGCPTNEGVVIRLQDGQEVIEYRSDHPFKPSDMEDLPDVAAYVTALDLAALTPPRPDMSLIGEPAYVSAEGWYEKTAHGVECIIRIHWRFLSNTDSDLSVYNYDAYIRLTPEGATFLTRGEAKALLGEDHPCIFRFPYEW